MNYKDIKVEWLGEILARIGNGVEARRILKPLMSQGATVKCISDEPYAGPNDRIQDQYWESLVSTSLAMPDQPVRVSYTMPNLFKPRKDAINIGYCYWDTTQFPREWANPIMAMDEIWVPSKAMAQVMTNSGIKTNVKIVRPTVDTDEWSPEGESVTLAEIPKETIKIMVVGNWIPRKNFEDLVTAYCAAFDGVKDVALIIKTWGYGADGKKNIYGGVNFWREKLQGLDKPKVYVLADIIEEDALIKLMRGCDIYVSASRGEGVDTATIQAMSLGKLVIATPFLTRQEFMTDENSMRVNYTLTPCKDGGIPLYQAYQYWAQPDIFDMVSKMRVAYNLVKTNRHRSFGELARKTVVDLYSPQTNTPRIAEAIMSAKKKESESINKLDLIRQKNPLMADSASQLIKSMA